MVEIFNMRKDYDLSTTIEYKSVLSKEEFLYIMREINETIHFIYHLSVKTTFTHILNCIFNHLCEKAHTI